MPNPLDKKNRPKGLFFLSGGGGGIFAFSKNSVVASACLPSLARESYFRKAQPEPATLARLRCSLFRRSAAMAASPRDPRRTRFQYLESSKQKKGPVGTFRCLVEAAGIEPASVNPLPLALHA